MSLLLLTHPTDLKWTCSAHKSVVIPWFHSLGMFSMCKFLPIQSVRSLRNETKELWCEKSKYFHSVLIFFEIATLCNCLKLLSLCCLHLENKWVLVLLSNCHDCFHFWRSARAWIALKSQHVHRMMRKNNFNVAAREQIIVSIMVCHLLMIKWLKFIVDKL